MSKEMDERIRVLQVVGYNKIEAKNIIAREDRARQKHMNRIQSKIARE